MDRPSIQELTLQWEAWVNEIYFELIRIRREPTQGPEERWYRAFLTREMGLRMKQVREWTKELEAEMNWNLNQPSNDLGRRSRRKTGRHSLNRRRSKRSQPRR
jgi:hypothetical protein